ncbi:MAG: MerR family transcriptional regulator [Magnetococcales bacterium]|nr:MerR family transcriptional regulator [Magnetococcales bacterium]MBF0150685.1 MerR family transcriptional regulator [Magnetococcales bacterium]MBF0631693.1 MerR family transcriptional regulator [Magnetococcales bacterium]
MNTCRSHPHHIADHRDQTREPSEQHPAAPPYPVATDIAPCSSDTGMVKIGEAARILGISIRTIHMYEREGLFISFKNEAGTRYFSKDDIQWLIELRRMIKSSLSIAGIRALMALIPCWEIRHCDYRSRNNCPAITDHDAPCWANQNNLCEETGQQCRQCEVYKLRFKVATLKNIVEIKLKEGP